MDIFQLQCFVSIIDKKSFTDAAYEVSISQSSLSKHISKLEDELQVTLLDRSRRAVSLTPAGRKFEPFARRILKEQNDAFFAMKEFSSRGSLHIGCIDHMGRVGLTSPISSFLDQFPTGTVTINMEKGTTHELMENLLKDQLDMAIIAYIVSPFSRTSNIDCYDLSAYRKHTLIRDEYHLIISKNHPYAQQKKNQVSWADLAKERLVILDHHYGLNNIIRETFRQAGLFPNIAFECDQVDGILSMVEEGFGVSILSKKIALSHYAVTAIPFDAPISRDTMLVVPRETEEKHLLGGRFVRHIVQYYEQPGITAQL